jgi:hypothetical protein
MTFGKLFFRIQQRRELLLDAASQADQSHRSQSMIRISGYIRLSIYSRMGLQKWFGTQDVKGRQAYSSSKPL